MRLRWTGVRRPAVAAEVRAAVPRRPGEQLLAWSVDEDTGATVVVGSHRLYAVSPAGEDGAAPGLVLDRPWHLVDGGSWDAERSSLAVTWVDGTPPVRWAMEDPRPLLQAFRERVQASVVLSQAIDLDQRRSARVVIRADLATGALTAQTLLGRGVRAGDPGVMEQTEAALARLREQVGLE
ncbi:MAG TPA: hypothetical protein VES95_07715 [Dermatophilaceae bacterium]|nr:hypothetical protein [Dermatophilaceae bacterium]